LERLRVLGSSNFLAMITSRYLIFKNLRGLELTRQGRDRGELAVWVLDSCESTLLRQEHHNAARLSDQELVVAKASCVLGVSHSGHACGGQGPGPTLGTLSVDGA